MYLFGSTGGGVVVSSVVADRVYDPVYDTVIDATSIYNLLPSFYRDLMGDQELFASVWASMMQVVSADFLHLWHIDYAKSLRDVPILSQRKWLKLDLMEAVDFVLEPTLLRLGLAKDLFLYKDRALEVTASGRARQDAALVPLKARVDQRASLRAETEISITSAQQRGALLFGYLSSTSYQALASTVRCDPDGVFRPGLIHVSAQGLIAVANSAFALETDVRYGLRLEYTARTGTVVLRVDELDYEKVSGTGLTGGTDAYSNELIDESQNFDALGVSVSDALVVGDETFTIVSVDGSRLVVTPFGLPSTAEVSYAIRGVKEVDSSTLDLPGEAADPTFSLDSVGVSNLDSRVVTSAMFSSPALAVRKELKATLNAWVYLDPTFEEEVLSLPRLQSAVLKPEVYLYEGTDYAVESSTILFQEPPADGLWAEYISYDERLIQDNFGANVGLLGASSDAYKARVRGLYYAFFHGPTVDAIRQGVHILLNLPIAEAAGTVESVNPGYSGVYGLLTVDGVEYRYPLLVGTDLVVGDKVDAFAPLSRGVEVIDYVVDPDWFVRLGVHELQKYHTFLVSLNIDAFDIEDLAEAAAFVNRIKPTWKRSLFLVHKDLTEDVEITDDLALKAGLRIFDVPYETFVVAYDEAIYEGEEPDWRYDQGIDSWTPSSPGMRHFSELQEGTVTFSAPDTLIGAGTSFTSYSSSYLLLAIISTGTGLSTTAGSHLMEEASAGAFDDLVVGDFIEVEDQGSFEILEIEADVIVVDRPAVLTSASAAWEVTGKHLTYVEIDSVTDDEELTSVGNIPAGYLGRTCAVAVLDPRARRVYYDQFEELGPEEDLTFRARISPDYVGSLPLAVTLPTSKTSTTTLYFTQYYGAGAGDTVESSVAEWSPP